MTFLRILGALLLLCIGATAWAYWTALSDPVVRSAQLPLLPEEGPNQRLRLVLISDIHVAGPDMPPSRLERIVGQINELKPDIVLIAGDLVSDKRTSTRTYTLSEAIAPLRGLRARLGAIAVLGNHDHWRNAVEARSALRDSGIKVLNNGAVRAGPLVVGGLDDAYTGHDDLGATLAAMKRLGGIPIVLSHSPDPFPDVPPNVRLMVAGHTHCGQIRLPFVGAISYMSEHGEKYACGLVRESRKTLIVGAGLGTSILPLRIGAVPDMWLVQLTRRRSAKEVTA